MKNRYYILGYLSICLLLVSCDSDFEAEKSRLLTYKSTAQTALDSFNLYKDRKSAIVLYDAIEKLNSSSIPEGLSATEQEEFVKLLGEVQGLHQDLLSKLEQSVPVIRHIIFNEEDVIIENGKKRFAAKLQKGDMIKYSFSANDAIKFNIYNIDNRKCIKQGSLKKELSDSLIIQNTAVYLFEIDNPKSPQYLTYNIARYCKTIQNLQYDCTLSTNEVPATNGEFMAYPKNEYKVSNLFNEPRKITLRGGWKAAFSGHKRTIVALNIPQNTTSIAYQLRIDTSEGANWKDGKFFEKVSQECSKVEIFGVTVKEKTKSHTSILREVLGKIETPQRAEEAYCSMYVFYNQNDATKFVNTNGNAVNYDVDYSIIGTQSCNGNIPVSGKKNVYLCFENDQFSGSIYLWIEAVATSTETNYYKLIYQ